MMFCLCRSASAAAILTAIRRNVPISMGFPHNVSRAWPPVISALPSSIPSDLYPEFRAISDVARTQAAVHVFFNDGLAHEQPDSRSLLRTLGREIGVEYLVHYLLRDSTSVVGNTYDRLAPFRQQFYVDCRAVDFSGNQGIPGINKNVEKNLAELTGITS